MQITHHLKLAGVMATPITWVNYQSGGSVYVQFADGRGRLKYGSASPGDFFIEHPGGETELMSKHDFERRYEVCDPDPRPQFHPMPPADVVAAAYLVGRYFAKQNIADWELGPCKARFPGDHEKSKHRAPLDGILAELRTKRHKASGAIRSLYNDVFDRLDALNHLEAQIAAVENISDYEIFSELQPPYRMLLIRVAVDGDKGGRRMKITNPRDLCIMACVFCRDPQFWQWADFNNPSVIASANAAKDFILNTCQVKSRVELDTNEAAGQRFHDLVRAPFLAWKASL